MYVWCFACAHITGMRQKKTSRLFPACAHTNGGRPSVVVRTQSDFFSKGVLFPSCSLRVRTPLMVCAHESRPKSLVRFSPCAHTTGLCGRKNVARLPRRRFRRSCETACVQFPNTSPPPSPRQSPLKRNTCAPQAEASEAASEAASSAALAAFSARRSAVFFFSRACVCVRVCVCM